MKVALRPFKEEDISPSYISWLNDKGLMRYSGQRFRTHTRDTSLAYLKSFDGTPNRFWAVVDPEANVVIGTMTAYVNERTNVADMGIMIGHPDYRGKGAGRKAWTVAMETLFLDGIRKVTGGTLSLNVAMIRIFMASGMHWEGCFKDQEIVDGRICDEVYFGIFNH